MPSTLRHAVRRMPPYASGEPAGDLIQLGFNESGFPPSPGALEAARAALGEARSYSDEDYRDLRRALARATGLDEASIVCGAGSMDIMANLARCCLEPGRTLVTGRFSYSFPVTLAEAAGARTVLVDEASFTHDVDAFLAAVTEETAVVYIANPNNPTGTAVGLDAIRRLAGGVPDHVLLMLDGAYADYADLDSGESLLEEGFNVAVLRTFSKIHGLAGMRVGWAAMRPELAEAVARVRPPGIVARPCQAAAIASLADREHLAAVRRRTIELREWFAGRLAALGFDSPASETNFLLAGLPPDCAMDGEELYRRVKARGIVLRRLAGFGLPRHLRITIGSPADMEALDRVLTGLHDAGW